MKTRIAKADFYVRTDRKVVRLFRKTGGRPFDPVAYAAALEMLG
jgi:hypothetical protein